MFFQGSQAPTASWESPRVARAHSTCCKLGPLATLNPQGLPAPLTNLAKTPLGLPRAQWAEMPEAGMEEEPLGGLGWERAGIWGIQPKVIVDAQKTDPGN